MDLFVFVAIAFLSACAAIGFVRSGGGITPNSVSIILFVMFGIGGTFVLGPVAVGAAFVGGILGFLLIGAVRRNKAKRVPELGKPRLPNQEGF